MSEPAQVVIPFHEYSDSIAVGSPLFARRLIQIRPLEQTGHPSFEFVVRPGRVNRMWPGLVCGVPEDVQLVPGERRAFFDRTLGDPVDQKAPRFVLSRGATVHRTRTLIENAGTPGPSGGSPSCGTVMSA